jgi:hypothetical protein
MMPDEHNKILAIGFAIFAAIITFTILLLMVVGIGVFAALGITFAEETGDSNNLVIGIAGAIFAALFYGFFGAVFIVPLALASWKMWKQKPHARKWGIIAALFVALILPLGTLLGIYGLWFFFNPEGKRFYEELDFLSLSRPS